MFEHTGDFYTRNSNYEITYSIEGRRFHTTEAARNYLTRILYMSDTEADQYLARMVAEYKQRMKGALQYA